MAGAAHPEAMAPRKKGPTRTAPPQTPSSWWSAPRIRTYLLFGATGAFYLLMGFVVLRLAWALGKGPEVWRATLSSLSNPLYIGFHALVLVSVVFVGLRAFGKMMPKMQPRGGPLPVLPPATVRVVIYGAWAVVTAVMVLVLSGVIF
jgi:fumarate reductase subunit C